MPRMTLIALLICSCTLSSAQKNLENVEIRSLDNRPVMSGEIHEEGRPMLLVFWATWCSHTKDGLTNINDDYLLDWQDDYNLQLVAVSVDDSRNLPKVRPFVNGQGWEFEIYTDVNGDFKRAMNVNNAPFFMLIDAEGRVVWQHNSYSSGDEETIEEQLSKLKS